MPPSSNRRDVIADQAIALIAAGGARALSHQAIDRAADLPKGSTSYYFRTREALVRATIERIRTRSRAAFDAGTPPSTLDTASAAAFIDDQLRALTTTRRAEAVAVFALYPEIGDDAELRTALAGCLFSRELATGLLATLGSNTPEDDARDLIRFLTGLLTELLFAPEVPPAERPTRSSAESITRFLSTATGD